jgi:hypothetical protein
MSCPLTAIESSWSEIDSALKALPSSTENYPKTVVNRVVNWWVNKIRSRRAA